MGAHSRNGLAASLPVTPASMVLSRGSLPSPALTWTLEADTGDPHVVRRE